MQRETLLAVYIVVFAFIHSLTAAKFFKNKAYRFVDPGPYRFYYTILSALTVVPLLYLWFSDRGSSPVLYRIGFPYFLISLGMVVAGVVLILNAFFVTDPLEFIGIKQVVGLKAEGNRLVSTGAYGVTRHPLYLGGMLIFWSNTAMRLVDLVVAFLFTAYFVVGGYLEEQKLKEEFGQEYRDYKERVSMFLPFKWLGKKF